MRIEETSLTACSRTCCPGCEECWGMSLQCHQKSCRCDLPCRCTYNAELDAYLTAGCERHNDQGDTRHHRDDCDFDTPTDDEVLLDVPCSTCGAVGACSWDTEGLPLIHASGGDL